MTAHNYTSHLRWQGSTANGYRDYRRDHRASAPPAPAELHLSADRAFRGDPDLLNPEQLLVMAASSCQLLSFLALAAQSGVDVRGYVDEADGALDIAETPNRVTQINLAPVVEVAPGSDHEVVRRLLAAAHEQCYVANSLNSTITLEPTILDAIEDDPQAQ